MRARILVVDDNRSNLDLMLYLLRAFGYDAVGANDGLTGIETAQGSTFHAVLADILMPEIDGYQFARRLKIAAVACATPLVAVTALAMVGDRERLLAAGFDGYIAKPIDPQTFISQVERYLAPSLRSQTPHRPLGAPEAGTQREASGPVVLAVDDVPANLEFIDAALGPFGYRVLHASSVAEAVAALEWTRPAVIVCDLHMPSGDGLELVEHVRSTDRLRDVPFLFLSSTSWQTSDHRKGLELGAQKFLLRPIDPAALRKEIELLLVT